MPFELTSKPICAFMESALIKKKKKIMSLIKENVGKNST